MNHWQQKTEATDYYLPSAAEKTNLHFDDAIFEVIPLCLKPLFIAASNKQERDVILLGALTIISGCLPNVSGIYDNRIVFPNLYAFIDAPAGAGKGILNFVRFLAAPIHKAKREETKRLQEEYEQKVNSQRKEKEQTETTIPPPPSKMLLIPANNSASSFVQTLNDNNGSGILFSTEADTLSNSLTQDWGNFSDVLRCSFHHEPVEIQRKTNKEYISLETPKLPVFLTGTQGQLKRLIPDAENGLFSRFMYYSMKSVPMFRDVFERRGTVPGQEFMDLGQRIFVLYEMLNRLGTAFECSLPKEFQLQFQMQFTSLLNKYFADTGDKILASLHRTGLICFRISMVLTCLRNFIDENKIPGAPMEIHEDDFEVAINIAKNLISNSSKHMAEMPGMSNEIIKFRKLEFILEMLPDTFTRKEANEIGDSIDISMATLTRYLSNGPFERIGHGKYKKKDAQNNTDEQMSI